MWAAQWLQVSSAGLLRRTPRGGTLSHFITTGGYRLSTRELCSRTLESTSMIAA
jgi:hypothetical protein